MIIGWSELRHHFSLIVNDPTRVWPISNFLWQRFNRGGFQLLWAAMHFLYKSVLPLMHWISRGHLQTFSFHAFPPLLWLEAHCLMVLQSYRLWLLRNYWADLKRKYEFNWVYINPFLMCLLVMACVHFPCDRSWKAEASCSCCTWSLRVFVYYQRVVKETYWDTTFN